MWSKKTRANDRPYDLCLFPKESSVPILDTLDLLGYFFDPCGHCGTNAAWLLTTLAWALPVSSSYDCPGHLSPIDLGIPCTWQSMRYCNNIQVSCKHNMSEDASALSRKGCCNGQNIIAGRWIIFLWLSPDQIFWDMCSLLSNWLHWMLNSDYIGTEQTGPHSAFLLHWFPPGCHLLIERGAGACLSSMLLSREGRLSRYFLSSHCYVSQLLTFGCSGGAHWAGTGSVI